MEFRLEALEPCSGQWIDLRPPEWWADETGTHGGTWTADEADDVVRLFHTAYPKRHSYVKPYARYRVTPYPEIIEFVRAKPKGE